MKKLSRPSIWQRFSRKWWLIAAGTSLVLLVVGFVGWSVYAWGDYKQQYEVWYGGLRTEARAAMDMKASSAAEKSKKLVALNQLQETAIRGTSRCDAYGWMHWQQFIGEIKGRIDGCRAKQQVANAFVADLKAVILHLQGEASIGIALAGAVTAKETDESSWGQIADKWSKARVDVQKLRLTSTMKATQKVTEEKAAAVEAAWRVLIAANTAKDRQKYEAALDQVATAYGSLNAIAEATQVALRPLSNKLQASYERVFS